MTVSVPTPPVYAVGDPLTASVLNAISDLFDFMQNPPSCRVNRSASQTITTGTTYSLLTFDSEDWDWPAEAMHDTAVNPSRIYCPCDGKYLISGSLALGAPGAAPAGQRKTNLRLNSAGAVGSGTSLLTVNTAISQETTEATTQVFSFATQRSAGDYFEFFFRQTQGTSINVNPMISVDWIGR